MKMINKEKIILNVRKYYDFNNNGNLPTLIYRTQPEYLKQKYNDCKIVNIIYIKYYMINKPKRFSHKAF